MAELSVFISDTVSTARWEPIGSGRCLYLRYREKPGFFQRRKEKKHLARAKGTYTVQENLAKKLSLPFLQGDGTRLIYALFPRLVPKAAEEGGLVLSLGREYNTEAIIEIARRVRTLELIMENGEELSEKIEAETGLCVPFSEEYEGGDKIFMRLPGGAYCGKEAIDLSCPEASCVFSPPEALRSVCQIVGCHGDTLEALLRFFDIPYRAADVFLSKITKLPRK